MRYNEIINESAEAYNWPAIYKAIKQYIAGHIALDPSLKARLNDVLFNTDTFYDQELGDVTYILDRHDREDARSVLHQLHNTITSAITSMGYNIAEYFDQDESIVDPLQNVSTEDIDQMLQAGAPQIMAYLKSEIKPVAAPAKKVASGEKFTDANVTQAVEDFKKMLPNFGKDLMDWFEEERVPYKTRKGSMSVPKFVLSKRNNIVLDKADMDSVNTPEEALQLVSSKLDDKDFVLFVIDNCRIDVDNRHNFWGLEKSPYWKKKLYNALAPVILTIKK